MRVREQQNATLTVVKDAIPDSTQPFTFSVSQCPPPNGDLVVRTDLVEGPFVQACYGGKLFELIDDGTGVSNTMTFTDGMEGWAYFVNEFYVEDWLALDGQCVDETGAVVPPATPFFAKEVLLEPVSDPPFYMNPSVSFDVQAGKQYTCTFTNGAPAIELTKTVGTEPERLRPDRRDHRLHRHRRSLLLRGHEHRRPHPDPAHAGR